MYSSLGYSAWEVRMLLREGALAQLHDILHMVCMWEHVYGLHCENLVHLGKQR